MRTLELWLARWLLKAGFRLLGLDPQARTIPRLIDHSVSWEKQCRYWEQRAEIARQLAHQWRQLSEPVRVEKKRWLSRWLKREKLVIIRQREPRHVSVSMSIE